MALDNAYALPPHSLPTPADSPVENAAVGVKRRMSRHGSISRYSNRSSVHFSRDSQTFFPRHQADQDMAFSEKRSSMDARRFTSDLDNSLLQQIHALRSELEHKNKIVDSLEESLHQSKTENARLGQEAITHAAESKSLKRQMQLLESGTMSALEDLAKERDSALESVADVRERLDTSNKLLRSQEETTERMQTSRERDQEQWLEEKRTLDWKVHVMENRLKTMVAEMFTTESRGFDRPGTSSSDYDGMQGAAARADSFSIRSGSRAESRMSNRSFHESRDSRDFQGRAPSRLSALHEVGESTISLSLAAELEGEDTEPEDDEEATDPVLASPNALPEEMTYVPSRYSQDEKARKVMGLPIEYNNRSNSEEDSVLRRKGAIEDSVLNSRKARATTYVDAATQYSAPYLSEQSMHLPTSTTSHAATQTQDGQHLLSHPQPSMSSSTQTLATEPTPGIAPARSSASQISQSSQASQILELETSPGGYLESAREPSSGGSSSSAVHGYEPAGQKPPSFPNQSDKTTQTEHEATGNMRGGILETVVSPSSIREMHSPTEGGGESASITRGPLRMDRGRDLAMGLTGGADSMGARSRGKEVGGDFVTDRDPSRDIPTIAIHPPSSRPPSSHTSVMLPPRTKNAATLANIELPRSTRSSSTQTHDQFRLVQLPPRHASSTATSRLHERRKDFATTIPPKSSRRKLKSPPPLLKNDPPPASPPISTIQNVYSGKNDDGLLNDKHQHGPRRPIRSGSILAGFSDDNDDIVNEEDDNFTDEEFATAPPIRKTLSKVKDSWRLVPQPHQTELDRIESMSDTEAQADVGSSEVPSKAPIRESSEISTSPKDILPNTSKKIVSKQNMRKAALVSSGSTAHNQRQRSPSLPSVSTGSTGQAPPPFPVPTRSSSRKLPLSASDGAASPTPYSTSFFTTRRQQQSGRPIPKRKILRKTQSAAAVTEPTMPADLIPPLPTNLEYIPPQTPTSPRRKQHQTMPCDPNENSPRNQRPEASSPKSPGAPTSVDTQGSDVIHAVTQTMIGEWMFKYVRKRRSFGITENAQNEFDKGSVGATRHKRWVWVLPRERAVVWSEKEPTTALAIGGKGARKLTIQSVVDVPDTTPLPKGYNSDQICNRSILILTPERALKLTAISRERHYIWLTALSYISSSDFNLTLIEGPLSPSQTPTRGSIYAQKSQERPSEDAAEPPQIPRVATHSRKRSSTGPKPMSLSAFHSHSTHAVATASSFDLHSAGPRDRPEKVASGPPTAIPTMTRSTTEPKILPNDAFDAIGTVRMEAFVEEEMPAMGAVKGRKRGESRGKRKDMAYWGVDDPFRGF